MERGKGLTGRGGKGKTPQYPSDLFALGSKAQSRVDTEPKRPTSVHGKAGTSHSLSGTSERKREQPSSGISTIIPTKKPKVTAVTSILNRGVSGPPPVNVQPLTNAEAWEQLAVEIEPSELVPEVLKANDNNQTDKVVGLICGALLAIKAQRWKPDHCLYLSLLYLGKIRPSLLALEPVQQALSSLLRRDASLGMKNKNNPMVPILVTGLLLRAYNEKKLWPEVFLKLYVDDALNERVWVDLEECKGFVDNIVTAFSTKHPTKAQLPPDLGITPPGVGSGALGGSGLSSTCSSPSAMEEDSTSDIKEESGSSSTETKEEFPVMPRYLGMQENVEIIVMDAVKEQLNRRQQAENTTRNFLRMLSTTCGLVEVRQTAAQRLEMWLQNPKLARPAQELLMYVCVNCNSHSPRDIEVMSNIIKIRLKTKALVNYYLSSIRELINAHAENLGILLKHTIYNELSNARNTNNMPMLSSMFQASPENAPVLLAQIFQEVLMNREDFHRPLRSLLRELVRYLRHDLDINSFCRGLMSDSRENSQAFRDFDFKERMYVSIVDLVCLSIFLAISPSVREAANYLAKGEKKDLHVYENFQMVVAKIQRDAMWWHHEIVLRLYRPSPAEFVHGIHKVMFMGTAENYFKIDNWPPEIERGMMFRLASEVPLLQNTLMRIFVIGLSKDHPLNPPETVELADQLVKRAAGLQSEGGSMLQANKVEIIDLIFNLSAYHHPENITLPQGYTPPQLAISNLYWKAWTMLLLFASNNPASFGDVAWDKYPTLRAFMEMCITNHFVYPPPSIASSESGEELRAKEAQVVQLEKQLILEFESHLAAASTKTVITEESSLLLPQLIMMDPTGPTRRPPQVVLDQLRSLNETHRMGHRLCRSRNPDFLLDIIQRQGASHSMPWLADLVESSEGALSHLPVQCLCEFLLSATVEKQHKQQQLVSHLRSVLMDETQDPQAPCEILEYFLRRLSSTQMGNRTQAIKGLQLVLSGGDDDSLAMDVDGTDKERSWLLRQLPQLPHFSAARSQIVQALRLACQYENDPALVAAYINFLAYHTTSDSLTQLSDLLLDMAQLIVERSTIIAALIPLNAPETSDTLHCLMQIFSSYLSKTREPRRESFTWSESQDQILVTWADGDESTIHILIVHAMIILLTFGPGRDSSLFDSLLETWFPLNKEYPKAFLLETSEEALLIPDWLKLRMIRSKVPRLIDAALIDLEPPQLVLFIQSFGIPVFSMSKLLDALDQSVLLDEAAVSEAVIDKNYMAQLVTVQHQRGAIGGHMFVQALQLHEPDLPDSRTVKESPSKPLLSLGKPMAETRELLNPQDVRPKLDEIFLAQVNTLCKVAACKLLQRSLAVELEEHPADGLLLPAVAEYFHSALTSPVSTYLASALLASPHLSCPLFRIITSNENVSAYNLTVAKQLLFSCKAILQLLPPVSSPLTAILKSFIQKCDTRQSISEMDSKQTIRTSSSNSQAVVESATQALLSQNTAAIANNRGRLIDRLVSMEPELIGSCPQLQMQLLFGHSTATMSCRPYLLTLLTHRASWATLSTVVQHLLSSINSDYEPTAVLDFLWALTRNPKLWQGREKNTPKHYLPENVLCLPVSQLLNVVSYMVEEATHDNGASLESRLPLLLQCTQEDMELVSVIVKHLLNISATENKGIKSEMAHQLLLQLYFRIPGLIKYLVDVEVDKFLEKASATEGGTSVLDRMSHLLFTALASTPPTKDGTRRAQEFELAARKMASVHPALVLRQLSMVASSLRGRVHLDYSVFRQRNHLAFFQQVIGILELLQPYIFLRQHGPALHATLDSYFLLIKNYGLTKEVLSLLNRVVTFLQAYISIDASPALKYLQTHVHLFRELQLRQPNLGSLCVLMSGVSLPRESGEAVEMGEGNSENSEMVLAVAPPPSQQEADWRPLLQRLEQSAGEELNTVLQDLESQSFRQPSILKGFVEPLSSLLLSPTGPIRYLSHNLLARYWRHDPTAASNGTALRAITKCLDSNQPEVVATALERLPEIVLSIQEHAVPLLQKVFALGMCSSINTITPLTKALSLLNLQTGS